MMLLAGAAAGLLAAMVLMVARAVAGPSTYDRILAANSFGAKTVLLIALLGYLAGRPIFLDIAVAYALINFLSTIAMMKFFRYRSLSAPLTAPPGERDNG